MACSKEKIEEKRLAALLKRQSKISSPTSTGSSYSPVAAGQTRAGPIKKFPSYQKPHPYKKADLSSNDISVALEPSNNFKVVSATVYLISENRFEVNPTEFCTPLINVFKSIPSKNYDAKSKLWSFSIDDYQGLMSKVAPLAPYVVLGALPSYVLKILIEPTVDPNSIDLSPIESTLRHKLMPFQEDGVRFAIARRGRCMIADDMGLGKTFQALALASYYRHNWPMLIVTTSSMRETWQSKIHELLPSVPLMNIVTLTSGKDVQMVADKQTEVVIVSYKICVMHTDLLKSKKFGVIIIDESHNLKSHKAQCTASLRGIARCGPRVCLLSGTPALSRPAELYTQLNIIDDKMFPNYTEFGKRYCAGKQTTFGWDMTGQSNLAELQIILQKRFLIRRTKEQVLDTLEGKAREAVLLDETLLQFSKEDKMELTQLAQNCSNTRDKHAALITFFAESARVKIPAICKYLKQFVKSEPSNKFLIFAHHRNMIDAICLQLDELCVNYICITGSTPSNRRAELVDRFQHSAGVLAAVLSVSAAGAGVTLTAAAAVLFAELHWNPGMLTQAESRAHRIGQKSTVRVRYLLAKGTADDFMWPMLHHKLNVLNDVGLSRDNFEDATTSHQESTSNITKYLTPATAFAKNKNDFIPGTNIRKGTLKSEKPSDIKSTNIFNSGDKNSDIQSDEKISDCFDMSGEMEFFVDEEGDELLANIDL